MATEPKSAEAAPAPMQAKPANPERAVEKIEPMAAALITFIGGAEAGDVGSTTWGNDTTGRIEFPLREPVLIDPSKANNRRDREFMEHIIVKARKNRFFTVEDAKEGKGKAAQIKQAEPAARTQPNPARGRSSAS